LKTQASPSSPHGGAVVDVAGVVVLAVVSPVSVVPFVDSSDELPVELSAEIVSVVPVDPSEPSPLADEAEAADDPPGELDDEDPISLLEELELSSFSVLPTVGGSVKHPVSSKHQNFFMVLSSCVAKADASSGSALWRSRSSW